MQIQSVREDQRMRGQNEDKEKGEEEDILYRLTGQTSWMMEMSY